MKKILNMFFSNDESKTVFAHRICLDKTLILLLLFHVFFDVSQIPDFVVFQYLHSGFHVPAFSTGRWKNNFSYYHSWYAKSTRGFGLRNEFEGASLELAQYITELKSPLCGCRFYDFPQTAKKIATVCCRKISWETEKTYSFSCTFPELL